MIDLKNIMIGGNELNENRLHVDSKDLNWDNVPDGTYAATMVIVYPWRDITRDTNVRLRDANGRYIKDEDGKFMTETVKDVKWHNADVIFRIDGGDYDNHAVKYSLSTHPNMVGTAKQFLYRMGLFNVSLDDLRNHTGATGFIVVKNKTENYVDKNTGMDTSRDVTYVSYIAEADSTTLGL